MDFKNVMLPSESYQSRSIGVNGQRVVNMYYEANPQGAEFPYTLYTRPCHKPYIDFETSSPIQGQAIFNSMMIVVVNNNVYKVDTSGAKTMIGSLHSNGGRVQMDSTVSELGILTDTHKLYVVSNDFILRNNSAIMAAAGITPISLTAFKGFFIVVNKDSQTIFRSKALDANTWDPLDFYSATESGDNLVAVAHGINALFLLGQRSIEIFYDTGGDDTSAEKALFQPIEGAANASRGCASRDSVIYSENSVFFLGDDGCFYVFQGYQIKKISTPAIDYNISQLSTFSDCISSLCNIAGHKFVINSFATDKKTFVYHISFDKWYEWGGQDTDLFRSWTSCFFGGKMLAGSATEGKLYELSLNYFTDDGDIVKRIVDMPPIYADGNWIFFEEVRIGIDTGEVPFSGQGSNPYMALSYSDNGGKTYVRERLLPLGRRGDYRKTIRSQSFGRSRYRIHRIKYTEPTNFTITSFGGRAGVGMYG